MHQYLLHIGDFPVRMYGLVLCMSIFLATGVAYFLAKQDGRWHTHVVDRSVNDGFSGGEIKRAELLQLMAQKPDLLLLDEPESGVDVENIALVGRAASYILGSGKSCNCQKGCCPHSGESFPTKENPLEQSERSGLIITHLGHILKYVPASRAHILFNGTMSCSGDPGAMFACISQKGYEHCINLGCGREF